MIRKGDRGEHVKTIQRIVGCEPDGIFGPITEAYVKKFQEAHLDVTGVVDSKTMAVMFAEDDDTDLTTDNSEHRLVINQSFLPEGEYCSNITDKEYIFLHHTAGWHNPYRTIKHWGGDDRGRIATEFVIGGQSIKGDDETYDGEVVQAFPEGYWAYHLGRTGSSYMHRHSVGIEVCNFGYLDDGIAYQGTRAAESQITYLPNLDFFGRMQWHKYSDSQIKSLRDLLLYIGERDNIDIREGLPKLIKKKGARAFDFNEDAWAGKVKGVWAHCNVRRSKSDMFPQEELLTMLTEL